MAHNFNHQTNIGLGESIKMGIKAPALADRIFNTWSDANIYIHDANSSAVNGLVLTVINDGNNNGGWFVDKRDIGGGEYELVLVRMGAGGGGSCDLLIPITYEALKNMRDTNQLTPGCRYRIIDYVTKANVDMYNMDWSQIDPSQLQYLSFSAEHPYDIIVLATDVNKLSEDAKAIQHEGDTYFSDSNLEAWELKYSLDNDLQYSWIQDPFNYGESILPPFPSGKIIVEVHGCKGVVFEMKDEFNNKADYDFKNIIYATDYDSDGVYSFDLYIDSNNLMSIVIPDSIDNPTQVVDTYSDVTVNCIYDDWEGWHIPYYNEQQCFVSLSNYLFNYLWYDRYYINISYIGYNNNGLIDTTIGCPEEIKKEMIEYIKTSASVTQYLLELYLDYTFSKGWHDYSLGDDDDNNKKGTDDVSLEKGGKRGRTKHIYKNLFSNIPVKEYKTVDGEKIKTYLEKVSEKRGSKKKDGEPKNRLSVLNRIEDIRKASVGDKKFTFEGNLKSVLVNSRKSANVRADSSSNPVVGYVTEDASLNIYDMESYEGYQPIAVAENEVHGYVVNYAESQEEYSQIGCRTLPMIVMHAYPDSNFNNKSSITFNKVSCDGYYGVTYIDCYWFEGNKLFFPDFQYNYMYAASYNAIYNYWDEIAGQIMGYPGQYGDKYWQQGDYRALNHRPDANITFEDSDGNELGSFNIGDDQQDDETIVIPTGGGMSTLTWRTPTKDEWEFLINYRPSSTVYDSSRGVNVSDAHYVRCQVNDVNGLILLPDVFTLPSGMNMSNINVNNTSFSENIFTLSDWHILENLGCIFLPVTGVRNGTSVWYITEKAHYWSSTFYPYNPTMYAYGLLIDSTQVGPTAIQDYTYGNPVRLITMTGNGLFSTAYDQKCNIAKSNIQFHCLNKEWRFAFNAYDIIGTSNTNVSENYDGWIDLFGYGTSGWNSGVSAYQPWSTNGQFLQQNLTGDYTNADWGIYNMSIDTLSTVAYTGDYNDLVKKPIKMIDGATSTAKDIVYCTQTEFDNLTPDVNTYYFIIPE